MSVVLSVLSMLSMQSLKTPETNLGSTAQKCELPDSGPARQEPR